MLKEYEILEDEINIEAEKEPTGEELALWENNLQIYFSEIPDSLLSAEEERRLAKKIEEGDAEAFKEMVEHNLRLVVSIANRYKGRGVDVDDLIQEGNIGLMRAIQRFDWRKEVKLSTYATWWIRQAVTRAIQNYSRTKRIPVHVDEMLAEIYKTGYRLHQDLEREPLDYEIAQDLGIKTDQVKFLKEADKKPLSLTTTIIPGGSEGEDFKIEDKIADPNGDELDEVEKNNSEQSWEDFLDRFLTKKEALVLKMCYLEQKGLSEAGAELGVSNERARQFKVAGLTKLRRLHVLGKIPMTEDMKFSLNNHPTKPAAHQKEFIEKLKEIMEEAGADENNKLWSSLVQQLNTS